MPAFPALLLFSAALLTQRLWPGAAPGEHGDIGVEANQAKPDDKPVGGKPIVLLGNVSNPDITLYPASNPAPSHPAVVVFPGGGYNILALDLEGTEVCHYLNTQGIAAVLLKYRVPRRQGLPPYAAPLQDAQRAVGLVRMHAAEWKIDPNHIGVLGFSAGGSLAAELSTNYQTRTYPSVDEADRLRCRPDFTVLIYPAYLTEPDGGDKLAPELKVTADTPPTFIVQTEDDPVHVENGLFYFLALKNAHVPAEMHLYSKGGHGYGLRDTGAPVNRWGQELQIWLTQDLKLLPAKPYNRHPAPEPSR